MNKRLLIWNVLTTMVLVLLIGLFIISCKPEKVYHVGILSGIVEFSAVADGFKEKMSELGYKEGKNIIYDIQTTNFDMGAYTNAINKFIAEKVDLIFAFPTEAALVAKAATKDSGIPVIFASSFIEDTGLVNSVREPGGNITGVRWNGPDIAIQRFELLRQMVPKVERMIIIYQRGYPIVKSQLEVLRPAADKAGIVLIEIPADNPPDLAAKLDNLKVNSGKDVLLGIAEPLQAIAWDIIGRFVNKYNLPVGTAIAPNQGYEPILGFSPENAPQGRQAAFLADKVLKGTKAGTLPVISAENFLRIDYKKSKELGLEVSESLMAKANEVIR